MLKKIVFLITLGLIVTGCSSEIEQLSYDEIKELPPIEQVQSIIENTELVDEFEVVIKDNSVAIVYPADYVHDSTLVLSDKEESFPNVAMTFAEHLEDLNFDEVVINSYEPSDAKEIGGLSRVSALFTRETIEELDFEKWHDVEKERPVKFYRHSDAYLIRGNVWDKLDDETKDKINNESKRSDSEFWDYYGSIVE